MTKSNIDLFASVANARLRNEDASLRKGYMRHLVSRVEVGEEEISGPSFAQVWWTKQDQTGHWVLAIPLLSKTSR